MMPLKSSPNERKTGGASGKLSQSFHTQTDKNDKHWQHRKTALLSTIVHNAHSKIHLLQLLLLPLRAQHTVYKLKVQNNNEQRGLQSSKVLTNQIHPRRSQPVVILRGFMWSVTFCSGSATERRQSLQGVVLVAVRGRRAEGEGLLVGETLECSHHNVRHVIAKHPGADQYTLEVHLVGPVCTVPRVGKTRSAWERDTRMIIADTFILQLPLSF